MPPRLKGRRRDERATTPHDGHGMGGDRIPPARAPAEAGCLGSSLQRGAARAAEGIGAVDSPLYARIPSQTATRTAPAAAEDGPAPVGDHVDVLASLEEHADPSRTTRVTHAQDEAVIAQRFILRVAIDRQDGLGLGYAVTSQTCCAGTRSITSTRASPRRRRWSPCSPTSSVVSRRPSPRTPGPLTWRHRRSVCALRWSGPQQW